MSRRRNPGLIENLANALMKLPPWVSVVLGVVSYVAITQHLQPAVTAKTVNFLPFAPNLIAGAAVLFFGTTALISAIHRFRRGRLVDEQAGLETLKTTPWKDFEYPGGGGISSAGI